MEIDELFEPNNLKLLACKCKAIDRLLSGFFERNIQLMYIKDK